jgi:hypothetical protein
MIKENNANGTKGFLMWSPNAQDFIFRVYNKDKTVTDYRILCEELELTINSDYYSLFSTENRKYIDFSTKTRKNTTKNGGR